MGCNYYAIPKATNELKDKIISAVQLGEMRIAKDLIPDEIHIGKSSFGWKFLFNHNDWQYFEQSEESLKSFLSNCDIHDEYHRPIAYDDFWKMVDSKQEQSHTSYGTMQFDFNFSNSTDFS